MSDGKGYRRGQVKISVSRVTEARIKKIRQKMINEHPDKYPEPPSYHAVIIWILDRLEEKY